MSSISREIVPLSKEDLFILFSYKHAGFDYPLHFHPDFELNLVCNTQGKRVVGDSVEEFTDIDLVLLGSNLPHKWDAPSQEDTLVITMYFHYNLLDSDIANKRLFAPVKELLLQAKRGICFSKNTARTIKEKLLNLKNTHGFDSWLAFFSLLYDLSITPDRHMLASTTYDTSGIIRESKSRRITSACKYIEENYQKEITLTDVAQQIGMSESAFSHFFKKRTSRNFVHYLNEVRIGHATQLLLETTHSISEISYLCGFGNLSNFNRTFKRERNKTPSEYRKSFQQVILKY